MLPEKTRHLLIAVLVVIITFFGSTVLAKTEVRKFVAQMVSTVAEEHTQEKGDGAPVALGTAPLVVPVPSLGMYATIIQDGDQEVECTIDASTLVKFFLCGTGDIRTIGLSVSGASYEWQQLDTNVCAPTVSDSCPTLQAGCVWNTVGTGSTYDLSAPGEYRVRVDSGTFYYFRSTLNPLDPQLIKDDIVCGNPGHVEVTNVPAGYEYSLNDPAGPYQDLPYFEVTAPGPQQVFVRLKDASETACVFPSNIRIVEELDIQVAVTTSDIHCSGEFGLINIEVSGVPGFYTYRLLKNGVTVDTYGPNADASYSFDQVGQGTYTVRVETNKCSVTLENDIHGNPIAIGGGILPIAVSATASDSFGCGATSVDVNLSTSGGTGPYTFSVDGGPMSPSFSGSTSFSVSAAGTYAILVEDANGCRQTAAVDVENIPPPIFTLSAEDANCGGADNGRVTVNVTNGFGYEIQYSVDNGANFQTSNVFSNLAPDSYQVVLRYSQDLFSCTTSPQAATVGTPSNITATVDAVSQPSCGNEYGGQISISGVSGGTAPYTYSIGAGFGSDPSFSNLGVGTYTPLIRDANGCVTDLPPIVFGALDRPRDLEFTISELNCLNTTATVDLLVTGGSGPYTYAIVAPGGSAVDNGGNATFTGLGLGTYTFRATDSAGCFYEENYAITDISSIGVRANQTKVVSCVGASDGAGRFLVDGFQATYSYSIDGGIAVTGQDQGSIVLSNLAAGSYTITVTDQQTHCTDTATLIIEEPVAPFQLSPLEVTDMSCQNGNRGSVRIPVTGGWGGYKYTLTQPNGNTRGPQNNNTFSNLSQEGTYQVSVTDSNGCALTDSFVLTALESPELTLDTAASDFCYDNFDASTLVVQASGGDGTYQYRIDNGTWGSNNTFPNLTPGSHVIEVRDGNGCRDSLNATIRPQLRAIAETAQELECDGPEGQIRVDISQGYTSGGSYDFYEVSIDGGAYTGTHDISGNSFQHPVPNDGSITAPITYRFRITDQRGCTTESNMVTLQPQETIAGSAQVSDTRCGEANGIVELLPDFGVGIPPYQFSNDGGASFSGQNIFSGYAPGTHGGFFIRDSRGCISPEITVTIADSDPLLATASPTDAVCTSGTATGSISTTVTDGMAPFNFQLYDSNGTQVANIPASPNTTENFANLPQGTYSVVVTDAQGCEWRDALEIAQNELDLVPLDSEPTDCGDTSFPWSVQATGGTGPYAFRLVGDPDWVNGTGTNGDEFDLTGRVVQGIAYFVEVRDTNGCTYIERIEPIGGSDTLAVTATAMAASCGIGGGGVLEYVVSGMASPGDFTVSLQNTDTGALVQGPDSFSGVPIPFTGHFSGLPPGNYQVIVQDAGSGCAAMALAFIGINAPSIVIDSYVEAKCNVGALVTVRGVGGSGPHTYAYVPSGTAAPTLFHTESTFEIPGPFPETYDFYVMDANGCTALIAQTVNQGEGVPDPVINVVNQCVATSGYQIDIVSPISGTTGLPEETFQYNIGSGFQSGTTFIVPNPGSYVITVRDGNGCTNTVNAEVFDFFSISAEATSLPTCNAGDGVITVNTTGGSGTFEYQLMDAFGNDIGAPQATNEFTGIAPGTYQIRVTDQLSNTTPLCWDDAVVTVTTVTPPEIELAQKTDISCFGANDGSIAMEMVSGTGTDTPFEFILYEGNTATVIEGPQDSPIFTDLAPGIYQVEVVSERGCTDRSPNIEIKEPSGPMATAVHTGFSCNPSSNHFSTATITIHTDTHGDGTGSPTGTGTYTFSMDDGTPEFDGTNFQTSNTFEVIDNGTDRTLTLTAKDQNGCEASTTITIATPTDITFDFEVSPISCDATGVGVNAGWIDVIVQEGPGNYEVEMLPLGSGTPRLSNGSDRVRWDITTPGDYIFAVSDLNAGGCRYLTHTVNMPEYNTIAAVIAEVEPVSCFNGQDGSISLAVDRYTGRYAYEVFSRDNAGVETSTGVTGTFDTNAPINSPEIIQNVPAGNLVVHIEALDFPYCDVISNVTTVRSPDRPLTATAIQTSPVTCNVPGLGEITAAGDGGWGTYEYQLVDSSGQMVRPYSVDPVFPDLSTGTYTVHIRDIGDCEATYDINLPLPTPISADIQVVSPLACHNDNDGIIEVFNVVGGQGPGNYLYQLNRIADGTKSGLQTTTTFANLSAGEYTITVFDGWNCSFTTLPVRVQDPPIVIAELVELQPPGCGDLGKMELTVTNPEPGVDYFYRRAGTTDPFEPFGAGMVSVEIAADITLDPGPFQYEVQNSNGCPFVRSNQISLDPAAPLVVALDLTNATINCAGEATGIIRSEAFGGIGNYLYTLLNSNTPPSPTATNTVRSGQTSGIFRELAPGTYYVYAQSGGCTAISEPIVITPKPPLELLELSTVDVLCAGEANGQVIIEARGGTGRIRYSISDTLSEFFEPDDPNDPDHPNRKTFYNLAPRSYDLIVQDDLGCTITRTIEIRQPMALVAAVATTTPEICMGDSDGTLSLEVSGGTAPYYTSINSSDPADFVQNDSMFFDGLQGGETYVVFIKDANGCQTNLIAEVGIGVDIGAEAVVEYGCEGIFPNSTATVEIADPSQLSDLLFSLDVDDIQLATDQRTFGDLPAGDHTVFIYHANGCVTFVEFTIEAYEPLTLQATKTGANEITALATGGFGDYEYFFQGESYGELNTFTINRDANIKIMVRDRQGCVVEIVMPFDFEGMPEMPSFFTPDGDNLNDHWYPKNREYFPNIDVIIYDRYGRVVAQLDQVKKWDGNYEGKPLPTGDYWYVVNVHDQDKQQFVGHFTLYR